MTTDPASKTHSVNEIWKVVREQGADIASLKQIAASTGAEVKHLGESVGRMGAKMDEVLHAVTSTSARQGPGLMQIMSGLGLLLAIVGGLSAGIAVFVGSMYAGDFSTMRSQITALEADRAVRQAEDRSELIRLRDESRLSYGARLKALEDNQGWAPINTN